MPCNILPWPVAAAPGVAVRWEDPASPSLSRARVPRARVQLVPAPRGGGGREEATAIDTHPSPTGSSSVSRASRLGSGRRGSDPKHSGVTDCGFHPTTPPAAAAAARLLPSQGKGRPAGSSLAPPRPGACPPSAPAVRTRELTLHFRVEGQTGRKAGIGRSLANGC